MLKVFRCSQETVGSIYNRMGISPISYLMEKGLEAVVLL